MKIAIFILARKGSKRIPNKNIKLFDGKPLVEYTLEFTKKLGYESHIFTDSKAITALAANYPIFIHDKLYENENGIHETGKEMLAYNEFIKADIIINLQVTSPIRNIELVKIWIEEFLNYNYDCALSCYPMTDKYIYDSNIAINYDPKDRIYNGGKKRPIYVENGSFYMFKKEQLLKNHITNGKLMICPDKYHVDLDTIKDWEVAEILYKRGLLI
jgi:CMP-N-acetylneuraminic acid synthetase